MNKQVLLRVVGLGLLWCAVVCAFSTVRLIVVTWALASREGVLEVIGYIVASGVVSALMVPCVLVLATIGACLTLSAPKT